MADEAPEAEAKGADTPTTEATAEGGDTSDATTGGPTPVEGDEDIEKIAAEVGGEGWLEQNPIDERPDEDVQGEHASDKEVEEEHKEAVEEEELMGENEIKLGDVQQEEIIEEQMLMEEMEQEPPPDPAAPYNISDSSEALKAPFQLRPEQVAEIEQLWDLYQNATPAYTDINGYITEVELVYLLKCLLLMTYTPEQLQELIEFCVRPPHPEGHITFEQFLKIATIRQRDFPVEEEIRNSLLLFDPENTGIVDREELREVLSKRGYRMKSNQVDNFIKEVDMSNDGTIGVEDVVGTLCIDLNREDIVMLQNQLNPQDEVNEEGDDRYD